MKIACMLKGHDPQARFTAVDDERCQRMKVCSRCGEVFETEVTAHQFVERRESVCEPVRVCEQCGHKTPLPTMHEFVQETEYIRESTEYDDWDKEVALAWIMTATFRCIKCGKREQRTERRELV